MYSSKRVEYSGGKFFGYENQNVYGFETHTRDVIYNKKNPNFEGNN